MGKNGLLVILTGERGVGKSTICRRLAERLRAEGLRVGGVVTDNTPAGAERLLMVHDLGGETSAELARTGPAGKGPKYGPFTFSPEGIYLGIKAIGRGMTADLLIVDEIGPFEMDNGGFFPVLHVIRKAGRSLLVIRLSLIERAVAKLGLSNDAEVAMVTADNHDQVLDHLGETFLAHFHRATAH
jgi:nucleoside-triphosphatase THEP1